MEYLALLAAALAFGVAWGARGRAARLAEELQATRRELAAKPTDGADLATEVTTLRRHVELLAKGLAVDPLMVREKRLFGNVDARTLGERLAAAPRPAVIDVRSPGEWSNGHIEGARHMPVDELEKRLSEVPRDGTPLYVVCAGGGRSATAAEFLAKRGYLNVFNVEGGMNAWRGKVVKD